MEWTLEKIYETLKDDKVNLTTQYGYANKKTKNISIKMSLGRIWFNIMLPNNFRLINEPIDKSKIDEIVAELTTKHEPAEMSKILTNLNREAFKLSTISPNSISIDNVTPSDDFKLLKQEFMERAQNMSDEEFKEEGQKLVDILMKESVNDTSFVDALQSGISGKMSKKTFEILMVSKGYCSDINGNSIRVSSGVGDGYSIEDYYHAANEARNGFYVKTQAVRVPGYLSRTATMAASNIKIDNNSKGCNTKRYLILFVNPTNAKTLINRYIVDGEDLVLLTKKNIKNYINKKIKLRSPLYCKNKDNNICPICYGKLSANLETDNIGILAAGALNMVTVNIMMGLRHKAERFEVIDVDFNDLIDKSSIDKESLSKILVIEKNKIYANKNNIQIQIDLNEYTNNYSDLPDKMLFPGIIPIHFKNQVFTTPFNFDIYIMKPNLFESKGKLKTFTYDKGELIFSRDKYTSTLNPGIVDKLLNYSVKHIKDEQLLLNALVDEMPKMDLVHLEILVGNMFRDADNPNTPARLSNYKNVKIIGCKQLPFVTGTFINRLAFQDLNKAIKTSLVDADDNDQQKLSPIDKIIVRDSNYN